MRRLFQLGVVIAGMLAAVPGTTQADQIFDFTITNIQGNVPGTVTGVIDLPFNGDGTGHASNVTITSYPSGLGLSLTTPFDVTTHPLAINRFTVSGGQITTSNLLFESNTIPGDPNFVIRNPSSTSILGNLTEAQFVIGPITFTTASAPEPGSIALLGTGLLALGGVVIGRRRKNRAGD